MFIGIAGKNERADVKTQSSFIFVQQYFIWGKYN